MNDFKDLLNISEYWKSDRFLSLENFENEEWKDINGYDGMYSVSNYGRVKSFIFNKGTNERILRLSINHQGYLKVDFCKDRITKTYRINRLVALEYIHNPLTKKTVNHIDANKLNNMVDNLEWNTLKENINHAWSNGLCEKTRVNGRINGIKFNSKKVYCPELDREFYSANEAGRQLNLNTSSISKCCRGEYKSTGKAIINGVEIKLTWKYI
jgi:hypothetical protein